MVEEKADTCYSQLRPVPDTQEVYMHDEGPNALIVDILTRVKEIDGDPEAARYHMEDVVDKTSDELQIWGAEAVALGAMPDTAAQQLLAAVFERADGGGSREMTLTIVFLLLVRLPQHDADLVLTVNLKRVATGSKAALTAVMDANDAPELLLGRRVLHRIVETFVVKDPGLFAA